MSGLPPRDTASLGSLAAFQAQVSETLAMVNEINAVAEQTKLIEANALQEARALAVEVQATGRLEVERAVTQGRIETLRSDELGVARRQVGVSGELLTADQARLAVNEKTLAVNLENLQTQRQTIAADISSAQSRLNTAQAAQARGAATLRGSTVPIAQEVAFRQQAVDYLQLQRQMIDQAITEGRVALEAAQARLTVEKEITAQRAEQAGFAETAVGSQGALLAPAFGVRPSAAQYRVPSAEWLAMVQRGQPYLPDYAAHPSQMGLFGGYGGGNVYVPEAANRPQLGGSGGYGGPPGARPTVPGGPGSGDGGPPLSRPFGALPPVDLSRVYGLGTAWQTANAGVTAFDNTAIRHGYLSSEMISAAARGELTYREWGAQIAGTAAKFAAWTAVSIPIFAAIGAFRELYTGAVQSSQGIAFMQRSIDGLNTDRARQQIQALSEHFNVTIEQASQAVGILGRVYHSQDQAVQAASAALYPVKLGGLGGEQIDVQTSALTLTAIVNAFKLSATDLQGVFDQINQAQLRFGTPILDSMRGLALAGGAFKTAGGDLTHLLALIVAINRETRASGSQIGTAIAQSISMVNQPRNYSQLRALGLQEQNGNWQQLFEDALKRAEQNPADVGAIARAFGGTRQFRLFSTVFANPERYAGPLGVGSLSTLQPNAVRGVSERELQVFLSGAGEQIKFISTNIQNLGAALAGSGTFSGLGVMLHFLNDILRTTTDLVDEFNKIPQPMRDILALVGEVYGVLRAARALSFGRLLGPEAAANAQLTRAGLATPTAAGRAYTLLTPNADDQLAKEIRKQAIADVAARNQGVASAFSTEATSASRAQFAEIRYQNEIARLTELTTVDGVAVRDLTKGERANLNELKVRSDDLFAQHLATKDLTAETQFLADQTARAAIPILTASSSAEVIAASQRGTDYTGRMGAVAELPVIGSGATRPVAPVAPTPPAVAPPEVIAPVPPVPPVAPAVAPREVVPPIVPVAPAVAPREVVPPIVPVVPPVAPREVVPPVVPPVAPREVVPPVVPVVPPVAPAVAPREVVPPVAPAVAPREVVPPVAPTPPGVGAAAFEEQTTAASVSMAAAGAAAKVESDSLTALTAATREQAAASQAAARAGLDQAEAERLLARQQREAVAPSVVGGGGSGSGETGRFAGLRGFFSGGSFLNAAMFALIGPAIAQMVGDEVSKITGSHSAGSTVGGIGKDVAYGAAAGAIIPGIGPIAGGFIGLVAGGLTQFFTDQTARENRLLSVYANTGTPGGFATALAQAREQAAQAQRFNALPSQGFNEQRITGTRPLYNAPPELQIANDILAQNRMIQDAQARARIGIDLFTHGAAFPTFQPTPAPSPFSPGVTDPLTTLGQPRPTPQPRLLLPLGGPRETNPLQDPIIQAALAGRVVPFQDANVLGERGAKAIAAARTTREKERLIAAYTNIIDKSIQSLIEGTQAIQGPLAQLNAAAATGPQASPEAFKRLYASLTPQGQTLVDTELKDQIAQQGIRSQSRSQIFSAIQVSYAEYQSSLKASLDSSQGVQHQQQQRQAADQALVRSQALVTSFLNQNAKDLADSLLLATTPHEIANAYATAIQNDIRLSRQPGGRRVGSIQLRQDQQAQLTQQQTYYDALTQLANAQDPSALDTAERNYVNAMHDLNRLLASHIGTPLQIAQAQTLVASTYEQKIQADVTHIANLGALSVAQAGNNQVLADQRNIASLHSQIAAINASTLSLKAKRAEILPLLTQLTSAQTTLTNDATSTANDLATAYNNLAAATAATPIAQPLANLKSARQILARGHFKTPKDYIDALTTVQNDQQAVLSQRYQDLLQMDQLSQMQPSAQIQQLQQFASHLKKGTTLWLTVMQQILSDELSNAGQFNLDVGNITLPTTLGYQVARVHAQQARRNNGGVSVVVHAPISVNGVHDAREVAREIGRNLGSTLRTQVHAAQRSALLR